MNMSQKLRIGIAAIVMIAACSDQGSAPVAPVARDTTPFGVGAGNPADQGTVTIKRTVEVRDPDQSGVAVGAPARMVRRENTISMGTGRVTVRNEDIRMQAALKAAPVEPTASSDDLPIVGLSFPAGARSLRQSIVSWHRSSAIPDEPGLVADASGTGDAPASIIRYAKNGVATLSVEQEWELWKGQWNLLRRETSAPDGSYHEQIEVTRTGRAGNGVLSAGDWAQGAVRHGATTASPDMYAYDEYEDCQPCQALKDAAEDAYYTLLATIATTGFICALTPPPADLVACWVAMGAVEQSYIKFNRAVENRNDCLAEPPPCPKKKPTTTDCSRRSTGAHHLTASFECGDPTDGGLTGGGSGGTDSGSTGHYECTYYFTYDMDTGEILSSEILYCSYVDGQ